MAFDDILVQKQVLSSSILPFCQIMKYGYPSRVEIAKIFEEYKPYLNFSTSPNKFCQTLLQAIGATKNEYKIGKKILFLRSKDHETLICNINEERIKLNTNMILAVKSKIRTKWQNLRKFSFFISYCLL